MQASYAWLSYVITDRLADLSRVWFSGSSVESRWGQPHQSACKTLLPAWTNANRVCLATERLVSLSKAWLCCEMFYTAYNVILLHLPRWMDLVLNLLTVPCVQWQCRCSPFYASLPYSVAVIAKIRKGIWKSFAALLVELPRFRTALTSRSSASRLLSDLFLQVRII